MVTDPSLDAVPAGRPRIDPSRAVIVGPLIAVVLGAVVLLWLYGLRDADPREMTQLGLVSLLRWPNYVALLLLVAGFCAALYRRDREWVLAAHLLTLIGIIHATPPLLYGTLRYSWAWKHLGIVDYILQHGGVNTGIDFLGIYHNWPGFFAGAALLAEISGPEHLMGFAIWAPVFFNVANLLALRFLLRSFSTDNTRIWLALLLYFITMWVGQDYFAPQAFAYLLALVLLGVVLRRFRRPRSGENLAASRAATAGALLLVSVLMFAIAMSHQITPLTVFLTLSVLWVGRQIRGWYLPVIAVVTMAGWAFTVARDYTIANLSELLAELNQPIGNMADTLEQNDAVSGAQQAVSLGGRAVIVVLVVVAAAGAYRLWQRGRLDPTVVLLAGAPGLLLFLTAYGGELLFRIFLFAAPALCYLAAAALTARGGDDALHTEFRFSALGTLALSLLLLPGFLLAYYGKDQWYYFTPQEVEAGSWIVEHSVPTTLLVRGNMNYPHDFRNYAAVFPVSISAEDDSARIVAQPVRVLSGWLSDPSYARAYVIITRSQELRNAAVGPMPAGALQDVAEALRASPRFHAVFHNKDAVVFTLVGRR